MRTRLPTVYIMASKRNGTLYTGVTSDLIRRVYDHRTGAIPGFTKRYGCKLLVWHVCFDRMLEAIEYEKRLKAGSRRKKIALIEEKNPTWDDLNEDLFQ